MRRLLCILLGHSYREAVESPLLVCDRCDHTQWHPYYVRDAA